MNRYYADLHNHTTASDGEFTPRELVCRAMETGLQAIGITDHDTVAGLHEAVAASAELDIEVVPGVEVSIRFKRPFFTGTLHLLCYFSTRHMENTDFISRITRVVSKGRGIGLVTRRVAEINAFFGPDGSTPLLKQPLQVEEIAALSDNASRRHFAMALSQMHGIDDPATVNRIIGNNSPAYLPSGISLSDMAGLLSTGKLLTVLAHPAAGSFPGTGHYKEVLPDVETVEKLLPDFLDAGLSGIEVYYPGHTPWHQELMLSWAEKYGLLVTGGSDCHDAVERPLGTGGVSRQLFDRFKKHL